MNDILLSTNFNDLKLFRKGKVRDVYEVGTNLLLISTDRISAFDVVLPNGIPCKGEVLNQISLFWFEFTKNIVPNHVISAKIEEYPGQLKKYSEALRGRSMLVRKTEVLPFECVVRGYLSGSAYKEYLQNQTVSGIKLPAGLKESDKLPQPLFTPATKEEKGHDINVDEGYMEQNLGARLTSLVKDISLKIYAQASQYAETKGIIIADTKFEFGLDADNLILIDEVLTPDSSRFWPKATYAPGGPQASYDKQFVRDYLESIAWDKNPPAPQLPPAVIEKTAEKYKEALKVLTGIIL